MRVTVPSFAKLNLDLRVLSKRSDGYHDLRTIFQTISLRDFLRIDFDFAKRTQIELVSSIAITTATPLPYRLVRFDLGADSFIK